MSKDSAVDAQGFQFTVINNPEQLLKIFSLRYEIFCRELGVFSREDNPSERETDEYDSRSIHVALLHQGSIVAYTRLILPCKRFPIEKTNNLAAPFNRERTVETSRAFVIKRYRHSNTIWVLFNRIYQYCQEMGIESILSFSNAVMFNGFKKRRVPMLYVGDETNFYGHKSYPLIINVDQSIKPSFY